MNELIERIFENFTVDGVTIPVSYMMYEGHDEPYITYMQQDADNSFSADDELQSYIVYYDFDIYAKGNYLKIVDEVKKILKENDFIWQLSMSSPDMYEADTGYFHKTLNFAYLKEEN